MKMTVLEMVQNILSAMESDEVNSIADTVESLQVAEVVRETYFDMIAGLNIPSNKSILQLQSVSDTAKPTYLVLPDSVRDIDWFKYDYQTDSTTTYTEVRYLTPNEFLQAVTSRQGQGSTEEIEDYSGIRFSVFNDRNPVYWTSFDNNYVVCDAYNSAQDTTLQQSKTLCFGQKIPTFTLSDSFVPELDADQFPRFLSEAKAVCFINFKGVANNKEEQRSRRGLVRTQGNLWRLNQRKPYDKQWIAGRGRS